MNSAVRKVALILGVAFTALFANLNYIQLARSDDLSTRSENRRIPISEERVKRGEILAADGTVLARSVPSGDERYIWRRRYPLGELFGHITGYHTSDFFCGATGLERSQAAYLSGREPATAQDWADELLGRIRDGNRIRTTLVPELQRVAERSFGKQRGGAAVIDSDSGAVLALFGTPGYDPNIVTRGEQNDCGRPLQALNRSASKPLLSRAFQVRYPPGSTFKIVTAAAGLELGRMSLSTSFRTTRRLDLPNTDRTLGNFGGSTCGGSMLRSMEVSCNTAFAQLAIRIGKDRLSTMAGRFGLNDDVPFELPLLPSCVHAPFTGRECDDPDNAFAPYAGIGQGSVGVTPLQMAMVSAIVGNGGRFMRPYLVSAVLDGETNQPVFRQEPEQIRRVYSARTASAMRRLMTSVVRNGTGRVVGFSRRWTIGGKTGTAQTGRPGEPPHVWFTAWGPGVAVAVVVENGGSLRSEATGGRVAGPIAKALLEYALRNDLS